MKCPNCGSEKVKIEAKKISRGGLAILMAFVFSIDGTLLFGIEWAFVSFLAGLLLGITLKLCVPDRYNGVGVCENCGHTFNAKKRKEDEDLEDDD